MLYKTVPLTFDELVLTQYLDTDPGLRIDAEDEINRAFAGSQMAPSGQEELKQAIKDARACIDALRGTSRSPRYVFVGADSGGITRHLTIDELVLLILAAERTL